MLHFLVIKAWGRNKLNNASPMLLWNPTKVSTPPLETPWNMIICCSIIGYRLIIVWMLKNHNHPHLTSLMLTGVHANDTYNYSKVNLTYCHRVCTVGAMLPLVMGSNFQNAHSVAVSAHNNKACTNSYQYSIHWHRHLSYSIFIQGVDSNNSVVDPEGFHPLPLKPPSPCPSK